MARSFLQLCSIASKRFYSSTSITFVNNPNKFLSLKDEENKIVLSDFSNYYQRRTAKKAIVKETKGKRAKPKVHLNEDEMMQVIDVNTLQDQLQSVLEKLKKDYTDHLSIRTASGSIENIEVDIENDKYPLNQIAQIFRKSPHLVVVNLVSFPEAMKPALQAIKDSGMNLNPQQDGTTIFVPLPKVTKEHRDNLVKNAKVMFNKAKDDIRNIQNKFIREAKKQTDLSEDLIFNCQQQIKAMTDDIIAEGENMLKHKQKELVAEQ